MIKVGVIRGGPSSEYEVSLLTGANILSHLRSDKLNDKYKAIDILIDKDGVWHMKGLPVSMEKVFHSVDVIWNALHGEFGEDGKVQQILDQWKIPYTGSGSMASAVGFNKELAKNQFEKLGLKTAKHIILPPYQEDFDARPTGSSGRGNSETYPLREAEKILRQIPPPWVVKPVSGGSSVGTHLCKTFDSLISALRVEMNNKVSLIVEEFIDGREATAGVVEKFRGEDIYNLPPIEIVIDKDRSFFDYEAKYRGKSQEICPGNFSSKDKEELKRLAKLIHKELGLSHYSRSDFIIHPKKGIYVLEVNTLPGFTDESLTPKALRSVGSSVPEFIHHVLSLARSN